MANTFKESVNMAIGKAAAFLGDQKEKASEFLEDKRVLYETKMALDESNAKLEELYNELGRVCYYGGSTVPGRDIADIKCDIRACLDVISDLQAVYADLCTDSED